MNFYSVLSVPEDASTAEIKDAFRKKAFDHHPDANQNADSKEQFQKILQAYETLRDPVKRSRYDAQRRINFNSFTDDGDGGTTTNMYSSSTPWSARPGHNPTVDEWERNFEEWLRRMENKYGEDGADAERLRRKRSSAETRARAVAWAREKAEAVDVKARSARIRQRAEVAKNKRHAAVLRRFWQARTGVTWQDVAVGTAFLLFCSGIAVHWKMRILGGVVGGGGGGGGEDGRKTGRSSSS